MTEREQLTGSWKKGFDFRYLAGEDLIKDLTLTIKKVFRDHIKTARGEDDITALEFEETDKLMAVNKGNSRIISKLAGSIERQYWVGLKIIIYQKVDKVHGQVVRVRPKKVK